MVIDVSVQDNGGLLPDIILLTQYYYKTETMCMPIHACIGNEDSLSTPRGNSTARQLPSSIWEAP